MSRLEPAARAARYGYRASERSLDLHVASCLSPAAIVYGFVEAGVLRGVGELHLRSDDRGDGALAGEVAFSVEAPWRCRGIGHRLMRRLIAVARAECVMRLGLRCASWNEAMLALARPYASRLTLEGGEITADLQLEPAVTTSGDAGMSTRFGPRAERAAPFSSAPRVPAG